MGRSVKLEKIAIFQQAAFGHMAYKGIWTV